MGSSSNTQGCEGWSAGLRLLAALLSIASLILLVKSEQTVQRPLGFEDYVTAHVKYSDTSAFIYLVFANVLVAAYCVFTLFGSIPMLMGNSHAGKAGRWALFLVEQALAYVQLSAVSAATEVAYLAQKGFEKTSWEALCPVYGFFCRMVKASILFSFVSVLLLTVLSVLSARALFHHFYKRPLFATKACQSSI